MANSKKKSIKLNAALNTFRTALNLIFPLITVPYISRVLAVDEIGKYNFSYSIMTYALLIAALGIDKYAIREGTKYRDDKAKISEFASRIFSINIVATVFSYLLLFVFLIFSQKASNYIDCILILSLEIFFTTLGTEWLYSIFEEYKYITIRSIIFKIISLILLFAFVKREGDYLYYAGITVISSVGSNVLNFIHARRKLCKIRLTFKFNWLEMMPPIIIIFATNVAIKIYASSDTIMLGYIKDDYAVGIYSISVKIYTMVKMVLAAALTVSIPRLAMYVGRKMLEEYDKLIAKLVNTLLVLVIPAMVGLMMMSKQVILIVAGKSYLQSQSSLVILSIAMFFSIFSTLFNQCMLLPLKREKYTLCSTGISALENIALNFLLIPVLAENGAAITTVLAELTMAIMNYIFSRDISRKIFVNRTMIRNVLSIAAGCVAIVGICHIICRFVPWLLLQTILSVGFSIVAYVLILAAFRNPVMKTLLCEVVAKNKQKC